ncbi:hypothetical protein Tco_1100131 [Tanacetum coccineum]
MRRDLQLEDAVGVDCLPIAYHLEQLTFRWVLKKLDGIEFVALMASAHNLYIVQTSSSPFQNQAELVMFSANPTDPHHTPTIIQPSTSQPQKKQRPRKPKRKDTKISQSSGPIDNVADKVVNEEMDDNLERAATTATSLDAEKDNETTKTTQANEIESLKKSVKKLKRRNKSRTHRLKRIYRVGSSRRVESSKDEGLGEEDASKQGRIADIDVDKDITLVNDQDDVDVNDLDGDEVIVDNVDVVKTTTITDVEVTLAQALAELNSAKPKAVKGCDTRTRAGLNSEVDGLAQRLQAQVTELVEESSKKAKAEIAQESSSREQEMS